MPLDRRGEIVLIPVLPGSAAPPPTRERLDRLEDALGQRLPPSYVRFLDHGNGAATVGIELAACGRSVVLERFLAVTEAFATDERWGWLDVEVVATQVDARIATDPDGSGVALVPIGALFAGDLLVLDYRQGGAEPSVGVWDHERSEDFGPVVLSVAKTFEAFLAILR